MKGLHVGIQCDEYPPALHGGIGSMVKDLAEGLVARGWQVTVFGIYRPLRMALASPREEWLEGVRVVRLPYLRYSPSRALDEMLQRLRMRAFVKRLVGRFGFDIVESDESTGWLAFLPAAPVPVVTRLHGGVTYFGSELGRRFSRLQSWFERLQLRFSSHIVAVSDYVGRRTTTYLGGNSSFEVIYNAIRDDFEREVPASARAEVLNRFGLRPGYMLFTGSVLPKKGLEALVKAASGVFLKDDRITLVIAGKNVATVNGQPFERYLRQFLRDEQQSRVRFLGHLDRERELLPLIAGAEFVVLPSLAEAFSLAPLEAMALGRAVIFSSRHSGPEVITDGVDGLLVDPQDVGALTSAMETLTADAELRERLGAAAQRTVQNRFRYSQWLGVNEQMYRRVVAGNSKDGRAGQ